jgi:uncharacterized membrane protein YkvA (DUF1232 family)
MFRLLNAARKSLPQVIPLMRDSRVPFTLKLLAGALAALVVSPIDIFGDIPVLGVLDDVALLTLVAFLFVRMAGKHVEIVPARAVARR